MLSVAQAKLSFRQIISDYDKYVEACQTVNELKEKVKAMIEEITHLIKPEYRVEFVSLNVMPQDFEHAKDDLDRQIIIFSNKLTDSIN